MPRCDPSAGLEDGPYCAAALVGLGVRLSLPMQVPLKRAFPALAILALSLPWISIPVNEKGVAGAGSGRRLRRFSLSV